MSLAATGCAITSVQTSGVTTVGDIPVADPPAPYTEPPQLLQISPRESTAGSTVRVEGYRLGVDRSPRPEVLFVRKGVVVRGSYGNSGYSLKDLSHEPQLMAVQLSDDLSSGEWELIIDRAGQRSNPLSLQVGDPTAPRLDVLEPAFVNPGSGVSIRGAYFPASHLIEVTYANGQTTRGAASTWGDVVGFATPSDAPDGEATVRVHSRTAGMDMVSNALTFQVTRLPLPLTILPHLMRSVRAGQWTYLEVHSSGPLYWSERTEVEFRQGRRVAIAATVRPDSAHIQVPRALVSGVATLRARTWRSGEVSKWSDSGTYAVTPTAVSVAIDTISVDRSGGIQKQVNLAEGSELSSRFRVLRGDDLTFHGMLPVREPRSLRVTLSAARRSHRLTPEAIDDYSFRVRVPADLEPGLWSIVLSARGMPSVTLPVPMQLTE